MKIIILAAGLGSRLGNTLPKPLTKLKNGKSIMQMMIENISSYYNIDDIIVVVGYKKDLIMESFPSLSYVYNPLFDSTNTSKSLLRALNKNKNSDILWFNGDVIFDLKILDFINKKIKKNSSFICVNKNNVSDEEVKYKLNNGFVSELSKSVKNGLGEAVGINYINSIDVKAFIKRLQECDDQDYFEKGLEMSIEHDNLNLEILDISKYYCMEIDFIEDLNSANDLF
jgi:choline kinase